MKKPTITRSHPTTKVEFKLPEVTKIKKLSRGRLRLIFRGRHEITAPSRVINSVDIAKGDHFSLESIRSKIQRKVQEILPDLLRKHLSRYPKTTQELIDHFSRKGYRPNTIEHFIPQLENEGFIDDHEVAVRHVKKRVERKCYGPRKLISELLEKGIAKNRAEEIVESYLGPDGEYEKAKQYVTEKESLEENVLASRLQNRGFSSRIIHQVLSDVVNG